MLDMFDGKFYKVSTSCVPRSTGWRSFHGTTVIQVPPRCPLNCKAAQGELHFRMGEKPVEARDCSTCHLMQECMLRPGKGVRGGVVSLDQMKRNILASARQKHCRCKLLKLNNV